MKTRLLGTLALLPVLNAIASAWPTGLNSIPIADVLGHRELYAFYGFSGTERNITKETIHTSSMQVGIGDRFEFGYDDDLRGFGEGNIKVNLHSDKKCGLSAGLLSIGQGSAQKYVVGTYAIGESARVHAGWLHDGTNRWMAGYDMALGENGTLMIDTISGRDSYFYIGFNWVLPNVKGFDVSISAGIPHERANGYTYGVFVGYGIRL